MIRLLSALRSPHAVPEARPTSSASSSLRRRHASLAAALCVAASAADARANDVTDWNTRAAAWVQAQSPLEQSRSLAIVQIAVHDALNAIERRHAPYAFKGRVPGASPEAAIATAAHDALVAVAPALSAEIELAYQEALAAIPDGKAKLEGVRAGSDAAETITSLRASDDLAAALGKPYEAGTEPGAYRATPPDNIVFAAGWGELQTFATPRASAFRPVPPPPLRGRRYARDYAEVKAIGVQGSNVRTPEQTEIADFWYESSSTGWHRIANLVVTERDLDLWESARVLGLVGIALADGFINGFDAKYHFNYWRPVTAIRSGDEDGNPRTHGDPSWTPHCATPPVADYPSTHSVLGAAAAEVLARYFGDRTTFTIDSLSLPGVTRSFQGFRQAARENAESRVYCGIHWRSSIEAGLEQGRLIGRYVYRHALRGERPRH